jgi:myxalamid-type polyketide synthase MxaB
VLRVFIRDQVGRVLGYEQVRARDDERGLTDLGLDSLMAVELSNRLSAAIGRPLSATVAFEQPSIAALAEHLTAILDASVPSTATAAPAAQEIDQLEGLSDEALERSLAEELDPAGY